MTVFKGVGVEKTKCASCRQKMGQNVTPFAPEGSLPPAAGKLSENCNKRSTFSRGAHPLFQAGGIGRAGRAGGGPGCGRASALALCQGACPRGRRTAVDLIVRVATRVRLPLGQGNDPGSGERWAHILGVSGAAARVGRTGWFIKKGLPSAWGAPSQPRDLGKSCHENYFWRFATPIATTLSVGFT